MESCKCSCKCAQCICDPILICMVHCRLDCITIKLITQCKYVNGFFFFSGNVWVYSNTSKVQYTDNTQTSTYCNKTAYLFTFWTITVSYILIGVSCICGLLIACCTCVCGLAAFGLAKK